MIGPLPDFSDVVAALGRIGPQLRRTPVVQSPSFDELCGRRVFLKCENLQHGGAFKFRGALNAVLQLPADGSITAVATHSSGNHGAALALAARLRGLACHVVMPEDSARTKIEATRRAGADITFCRAGIAARETALAEVLARTAAHLVHPFDDARVIAGQGTAALELLGERPELETLAAPVGGGGLIGGTALAVRGVAPHCRVVGVEPAAADDACRSFRSGRRVGVEGLPQTLCDGLRASIGALNFELLRQHVDDVLTVTEPQVVAAMREVLVHFRLLVEPSSAVAIAAALDGRLGAAGSAVGIIVSGGNVDLDACPFLSGTRPA
jgi:threonine dehydratase